MTDEFNLFNIYEQNINFLIGAGASHGFLPTLAVKIRDIRENKCTFETLAKQYEGNEQMRTLLFMLYYSECIKPGLPKIAHRGAPLMPRASHIEAVINEYKRFMITLIQVLDKQKSSAKRANIFTTNYDNCFETASEELLAERSAQFNINDGSAGFQRRIFHTRNFNHRVVNRGAFERHDQYLPQINLLHAHGSVHWEKGMRDGEIELNYGMSNYSINLDEHETEILHKFKEIIYDENKTVNDLHDFQLKNNLALLRINEFWQDYNKIPIVNPTKWKFHETVFEETYYQILRYLSYELERPNSALITFGFSFADEHILSLVQRSLSNPSLIVYISCFNDTELDWMKEKFKEYHNVQFIYSAEKPLYFAHFNDTQFTLNKLKKGQKEQNEVVNAAETIIGGGTL
ncbi:SIR2 family protein [Pectobacterium versatile]|uniref:SIR2 family protein n=2 Tax=Pectobacterium versatile TaxID=2488639 RepID=UPI001F41FC66|nr:SIR2 family protein [Pectobacterium versatile]